VTASVVLDGGELGGKEGVDQSSLSETRLANDHESKVSAALSDCSSAEEGTRLSERRAGACRELAKGEHTDFVPLEVNRNTNETTGSMAEGEKHTWLGRFAIPMSRA
jgi:hypothetical protein